MIGKKVELGELEGGKEWKGAGVRMDPSHLVPEAEQGRGKPDWQDSGRRPLQVPLERWRWKRKEDWRLSL